MRPMHVQRDAPDNFTRFLLGLSWKVPAAVLLISLLFDRAVEGQTGGPICSRTAITGSTALDSTDTLLVIDADCASAVAADYKRATLASMLLLTGRVTVHATSCTGTTALAPAVCVELDDNTAYFCDQAAGSSCAGANWTELSGGAADSKGIFTGGTAGNLSTTVDNYFPINGVLAPTATEGNTRVFSGGAEITPTRFKCVIPATPGAGNSYAFTLRNGAGDTDLTCTIADAASSCEDTSGSAIPANNFLSVESTPASGPTAQGAACSLEFDF